MLDFVQSAVKATEKWLYELERALLEAFPSAKQFSSVNPSTSLRGRRDPILQMRIPKR